MKKVGLGSVITSMFRRQRMRAENGRLRLDLLCQEGNWMEGVWKHSSIVERAVAGQPKHSRIYGLCLQCSYVCENSAQYLQLSRNTLKPNYLYIGKTFLWKQGKWFHTVVSLSMQKVVSLMTFALDYVRGQQILYLKDQRVTIWGLVDKTVSVTLINSAIIVMKEPQICQ